METQYTILVAPFLIPVYEKHIFLADVKKLSFFL